MQDFKYSKNQHLANQTDLLQLFFKKQINSSCVKYNMASLKKKFINYVFIDLFIQLKKTEKIDNNIDLTY